MNSFSYGNDVMIDKADQGEPVRLYKKVFKSKRDKQILDEFRDVVLKYYPNYTERDIAKLYESLSKEGCAYASLANTLISQLGFDNELFKEKFGFSLISDGGEVNYNKVMLDIYACLKDMVQLDASYYEFLSGKSLSEITEQALGKSITDISEAVKELFSNGWIGDGKDEEGELVFKSRTCTNRRVLGSYFSIAKELFGIELPGISKDELCDLLRQKKIDYRFSFESAPTKLSGLLTDKVQNKWVNKYFEEKGIELTFESNLINSSDYETYEEFKEKLTKKRNAGAFIGVSTSPNSNVWMTDGKGLGWMKPSSLENGHQMTLAGFDDDGNILVSTYGNVQMIPKEFYGELRYTEARIHGYDSGKDKNLDNVNRKGNKSK